MSAFSLLPWQYFVPSGQNGNISVFAGRPAADGGTLQLPGAGETGSAPDSRNFCTWRKRESAERAQQCPGEPSGLWRDSAE